MQPITGQSRRHFFSDGFDSRPGLVARIGLGPGFFEIDVVDDGNVDELLSLLRGSFRGLRVVHESILARHLRQYVAPISQISRGVFKVKKLVIENRHHASSSGLVRQTILIAKKDLAIELATGEIVATSGFFGLLLSVLSSLALSYGADIRTRAAPGVIWLSFSPGPRLSRAWTREREEGALVGLVVSPVSRSAIFAGKALGIFTFIAAIEAIVIPAAALLLGGEIGDGDAGGFDLVRHGGALAVIALFANVGIAATGTLFGALTVRTRARDLVLASVLLPLLAPTLGSAVSATRELFEGATLAELADYLELMLVFDVVFVSAGLGLFGWLIEG
jgi:heme exporter protein B